MPPSEYSALRIRGSADTARIFLTPPLSASETVLSTVNSVEKSFFGCSETTSLKLKFIQKAPCWIYHYILLRGACQYSKFLIQIAVGMFLFFLVVVKIVVGVGKAYALVEIVRLVVVIFLFGFFESGQADLVGFVK